MATLYGSQYQAAFVDVPSSKISRGDQSGNVRFLYFNYAGTAAPTNADVIKLAKLPKGSRVVDVIMSFADLGSAGTLEVGWAASAELDSAGAAVEAAVAAGFLASLDVNSAADTIKMSDNLANGSGMLKQFSAEVDVQVTVTAAWTVATGGFKGCIMYVVV